MLMSEKQVLMRGNKWVEMGTRRGKWQVMFTRENQKGENTMGGSPINARHMHMAIHFLKQFELVIVRIVS